MVATSPRSIGPVSPTSGRSTSSTRDHLDLTDAVNGHTRWYRVPPGKSLVSVSIQITDGQVWQTAVVDMQWALKATDADDCFAVTYSPAVQFTTSVNSRAAIGVTGSGYIRLKTTKAGNGDDPKAKVILDFF